MLSRRLKNRDGRLIKGDDVLRWQRPRRRQAIVRRFIGQMARTGQNPMQMPAEIVIGIPSHRRVEYRKMVAEFDRRRHERGSFVELSSMLVHPRNRGLP